MSIHGNHIKISTIAGFLFSYSILSCSPKEPDSARTHRSDGLDANSTNGLDANSTNGLDTSSTNPFDNNGFTNDTTIPPSTQVSDSENIDVGTNYTRKRVTFTGSRGDSVPAYLYKPLNLTGQAPAILMQYGINSSKDSNKIAQLSEFMTKNGFIIFTIDVPGRGERTTSTGEIDVVRTVMDVNLVRWYLADYRKAVDYLSSQSFVNPNKIGFVGASWGAITGITYAASDARIKALVSVVGGGGFYSLLGILDPSYQELDPAIRIKSYAPRPVLLINAVNDQLILKPLAEMLHNNAGSNAQKIWLQSDHTLSGVNLQSQVIQPILTFMNSKLR